MAEGSGVIYVDLTSVSKTGAANTFVLMFGRIVAVTLALGLGAGLWAVLVTQASRPFINTSDRSPGAVIAMLVLLLAP